MRYQFEINGVTVRGELGPEQVVQMAASGTVMEVLRRRLFGRDSEQHVGEYTDAQAAALVADGWTQVRVLSETDDVAPAPVQDPEPGPFRVTKLALRRAFRAMGLESALDATVAALPTQAASDYADANDLASDDPMLVAAIPFAARAVGMTEAEAWAMLRQVAEGGAL